MRKSVKLLISLTLVIMAIASVGGLRAEADCRHKNSKWFDKGDYCESKCLDCGEPLGSTQATGHLYENYESDDIYHWRVCKNCGHEDKQVHDNVNITKKTATGHQGGCLTCGHQFNNAAHISSNDYTHDSSSHWKVCIFCGQKLEEKKHVFKLVRGGVTPPGTHLLRCACGYEKSEEHEFPEGTGLGAYQSDENAHWQICLGCGEEGNRNAHDRTDEWVWEENRHHKICETCGSNFSMGEHKDDGTGKCRDCRMPMETGTDYLTLQWIAEHCDKGCRSYRYIDGTAYKCWVTCEGGHATWECSDHEGGAPTCKEKKYCPRCGRYYWLEHNYENGVCTECGAIQPSDPIPSPEPTQSPTPTTTPSPEPTQSPIPTTTPSPEPTPEPEPTTVWYKDVYYHWQEGGEKEFHKPIPATCTKPISCICGAYVGKPRGHQYDSNGICTVCMLSREQAEKNVPFDDVNPGDWYYDNGSVKFVTDNGYIDGLARDRFEPNRDMYRETFILALYKIEGKPSTSGDPREDFNDVSSCSNQVLRAINWGNVNGIMTGMGGGKFGPYESISRQQMAVALKRYSEYRGNNTSRRADLTSFSDYNDIFPWAEEALSWAVASRIIQGDSNNRLNPQANATRAQVATMLMNYLANK